MVPLEPYDDRKLRTHVERLQYLLHADAFEPSNAYSKANDDQHMPISLLPAILAGAPDAIHEFACIFIHHMPRCDP